MRGTSIRMLVRCKSFYETNTVALSSSPQSIVYQLFQSHDEDRYPPFDRSTRPDIRAGRPIDRRLQRSQFPLPRDVRVVQAGVRTGLQKSLPLSQNVLRRSLSVRRELHERRIPRCVPAVASSQRDASAWHNVSLDRSRSLECVIELTMRNVTLSRNKHLRAFRC